MVPIGEAARQSGVHIETIRYYEREGVIAPPGRSAAGRRLFTPAEIARLRFIRRCRGLGFSINDIRALMGLTGHPDTACGEVAAMGRAQLADVHSRIARLQELARALEELVSGCDSGNTACPMLEDLMR